MNASRAIIVAICLVAGALALPAFAEDLQVRLNSIGFLPDGQKRASIAAPCSGFAVVRVGDGRKVLSGKVGPPAVNPDMGETLALADFSKLHEAGAYYLEVPGVGRSAEFRIAADVYNFSYYTVMRGMYLWRCGTAVGGRHNGQTFSHGACHLDDAYLDFVGSGHAKKDGVKGWHDAGDYNKYVVNAGFTVGVLFQAWEHFGPRIRRIGLDLPESGNGTPDFLSEIRWELEWLLSMQMEDGRVYHKVSARRFGGFVMPEKDTGERYFAPWSTAATADFAAVIAIAARDFEPFDPPFARKCLAAARKSYGYLAAHPENHRADLSGFSTGAYQANDSSRRLWAAGEMWQTTGDPAYLKDFQTRANALPRKVDRTCGWANVTDLGMYTYLLSRRGGKDPSVADAIRADLLAVADEIVRTASAHGYGRPVGTAYYWGCNGDVAQQVQTLQVANMLRPDRRYVDTALDALAYLFGRNPYGRSFVTGLGHDPPLHPHDRRSANNLDPWPGYLVGGGWPKATDWQDKQENYRVNEIAINWNAALIYALAGFVEPKP